jgi:enamine deaminase RidA (YjgF/YER057c/UK114 family)
MNRDIVKTAEAPSPSAAYSQAVKAAGLVFVSGTGPYDPASNAIVGTTIHEHRSHPEGRRQLDGKDRQRHRHPAR